MSYSAGLNPDVVKTALDDVFYAEFDGNDHPSNATASSADIFKQESIDNAADIQEIFKGTGLWETKAEEQDVPQATPQIANQITHNVVEFAQSVDVPRTFFDDSMHNAVNRMIRDMADTGRVTRDNNAFNTYRKAFTTTLVADGSALVADAHTTIGGFTVDNRLTSALSPTSLNDAIKELREQKAQDGTIRGNTPKCLLVPQKLYKKAVEITESVLESDTANNALNVFSAKYGISIYTSPYLGAAAGGSDTAWFLLARNHSVTRWVRQDMITDLVDWRTQRNNNYIYKGSFREVVGALDHVGVIGSTGTGA